MTKKILPLVLAVMMTACSKPVEQAQGRVDNAKVIAANQNAALMFQNAQNYCSQCQSKGVTVKAGRYCGDLGTTGTLSYSGDTSDFAIAESTYTNAMAGGYFCVMIDSSGKPSAAYWSETTDLSQEQFPPMSEPFKVTTEKLIGRHPEGAEAE